MNNRGKEGRGRRQEKARKRRQEREAKKEKLIKRTLGKRGQKREDRKGYQESVCRKCRREKIQAGKVVE
jgi:hypothetical protein